MRGQIGRDDRAQLDHGVVAAPLHPPGPHDDAGTVERQVGGVEEVHLPDLRRERVEVERDDQRAPLGVGQRELELDAVGLLDQGERLEQVLVGESERRGIGHAVTVGPRRARVLTRDG